MNTMRRIREWYKVPAKRGRLVRFGDIEARITGTPRDGSMYLYIKTSGGWRYLVHPTSIEYPEEKSQG